MKFNLTQDHIERGKVKNCGACPVALVIQETMHDPNYLVDGETVIHHGYDLWMLLPEEVDTWVDYYDMFYKEDLAHKNDPDYWPAVRPIEFELPLDRYFGRPYTEPLVPLTFAEEMLAI